MRLQTQVNDQGTLIIQMPQSFWGKQVIVSIASVPPIEATEAILAWQQIHQTLKPANKLDLPRKNHDEIIAELRNFRETQ